MPKQQTSPRDDADIVAEKASIRAFMKKRRAAIGASLREHAEEVVAHHVLELPELREVAAGQTAASTPVAPAATSLTVGVYASLPSELSLAPLIRQLYALGVKVAYPCVRPGRHMDFYRVEQDEQWDFLDHPARIHLVGDDPLHLAERLVGPQQLDLLLVPGIAFDERCLRLGFGGGFYDTYLVRLQGTRCTILGVAFDEQVVEGLPCGEFDQSVPCIITPTRTLLAPEQGQR
jgi:5-formyltetrahydrofolate cyclo-ligase